MTIGRSIGIWSLAIVFSTQDGKVIVVLYSNQDKSWKIADFGLTCEATSKGFHTSTFARGTDGYRAPELLKEGRHYNNKSDIWSLGCILHELGTERKAFANDFQLLWYSLGGPTSQKQMCLPSDIVIEGSWRECVAAIINVMLEIYPANRPSAGWLVEKFNSYRSDSQMSLVDVAPSNSMDDEPDTDKPMTQTTSVGNNGFDRSKLSNHYTFRKWPVIPEINLPIFGSWCLIAVKISGFHQDSRNDRSFLESDFNMALHAIWYRKMPHWPAHHFLKNYPKNDISSSQNDTFNILEIYSRI